MPSTSTLTASRFLAAYLALRLPSGTWVRRAGDAASSRMWAVQDCGCPDCVHAAALGAPASHYELRALGGASAALTHVSHTAVVPVPDPDEIFERRTMLTPKAAATHLRRLLRYTFPGVRFSVRRGRGTDRYRLMVRWSGGPGRDEVGAAAAPLLADYATPGRRRPRPIAVQHFGHTHIGTPMVDEVRLERR
ncbi:LPD29 domain-containing protein [Streptomyces sp. NBC_01601]|uniref:LPD29 domain-containing protein n=1 Tax=Streptomyces sp. NBC_01601 TaxID=2975892 RepID=UPI002E28DC26|nr:LPD29 domain-containing protein [Streptomyces sp. NBC_01601]